MIYGFSLLFLLLFLVISVPAFRQMLFMRDVNKNGATTTGEVKSSKSAMGWLWMSSFGNQDRPLIRYQSPSGTEMLLEVTTSSVLPKRRYEPGQALEVKYDSSRPGRAYLVAEWQVIVRELWLGSGAFAMSIILWVVGRLFNAPF
jgi:hypothetical protein